MTTGLGPYEVTYLDRDPATATLEATIVASKPTLPVDLGGGLLARVETFNGGIPGPVLRLDVGEHGG